MTGFQEQLHNIDGTEVSKRKVFGFLALATMVVLVPFRDAMPEFAWVVALGVLGWSAALCLFQSSHRVCVVYAARGIRNLGEGIQPVDSPRFRQNHRSAAGRVHLLAGASWGITTTAAAALAMLM